MKRIKTIDWNIVPNGGQAVAIVESSEYEASIQILNDTRTQDDGTSKSKPSICTVAKKKMI